MSDFIRALRECSAGDWAACFILVSIAAVAYVGLLP